MIVFIIIICVELIGLYIISRRLSQNLFISAFLLTKSRPVAVGFLSLIFFPGTVIHELAHLFTAEILGVRTSGLTLVPEGIEEKDVRTGSVSIAQSDPIRRAVIGIAPIFVGLGMLGLLSFFFPGVWQQVRIDAQNGILFSGYSLYLFILMGYALFAVSNTMFSSPEDLEGFWPVVAVLSVVSISLYFVGIRFNLTEMTMITLTDFFGTAATNLGYITALNIALFFASTATIRLVERATKRRLVTKN
jgi:hypothetical protein